MTTKRAGVFAGTGFWDWIESLAGRPRSLSYSAATGWFFSASAAAWSRSHDFGFDFKLALDGAYSSDLQSQLENFVQNRYIREVPSTTDIAGYRTSKFVTSPHSPKILKILGLDQEPAWKNLANDLNQRTSRELEATSTIMFLRRNGTQDAQLPEKFAALKPHLIAIYESGIELANKLHCQAN